MEDYQKNYPLEFRNDIREIIGSRGHVIADVSAGDYIPDNKRCRYFECSEEGYIKIDYTDDRGVSVFTRVINAIRGVNHYPNIIKVYQYYVGTTPSTATVHTDAGVEVVGIALNY